MASSFIEEPVNLRQQFREFDISAPTPGSNDPFNINTATFDAAGAFSIFASFVTLLMPETDVDFRDDTRIQVYRNGVNQSKGVGPADNRDVYFVSVNPPKIAFESSLQNGDIIQVVSPDCYAD